VEKTPEQRINYPEAGDWVVVEKDVIVFDAKLTAIEVKAGSVGLMLREEYDKEAAKHTQSVHDCIVYVVDINGVEVRFGFGDVVGTNPLDQMVREVDHD
jgi:hypothetical protein